MHTTATTITITETAAPSRSKAQLWARVDPSTGGDAVFASPKGRTVEVDGAFTVQLGGTIRRATRTETLRESVDLRSTGDPADVVELCIGAPQRLEVTVTGAVRA